jgi:endonuclease-8
MEGPSIVIACEELAPFFKREITLARGTARLPLTQLKGSRLLKAKSWGKHLWLEFSSLSLRIHFLMFGSYRINNPRENRTPKLELKIGDDRIYFYSCAIKVQTQSFKETYDTSRDLMSPNWDVQQARAAVRARSESEVCDVLMDQDIFAGLGNIMKNEILFNLRMHPQARVKQLTPARLRALVKEAEAYAWQFYEWKKINQLKRNWKIMRKRACPVCGRKVQKKPTGKLARISHFCRHCQRKA